MSKTQTLPNLDFMIREALTRVKDEKPPLPLELRVGERPLVARLALHLERLLSHHSALHVDVEYNIDPYGDRKWLDANPELKRAAELVRRKVYENESIVVIPDVIVHKRGRHDENFGCIEVKFVDAGPHETDYATLKLRAFKNAPFFLPIGHPGNGPATMGSVY